MGLFKNFKNIKKQVLFKIVNFLRKIDVFKILRKKISLVYQNASYPTRQRAFFLNWVLMFLTFIFFFIVFWDIYRVFILGYNENAFLLIAELITFLSFSITGYLILKGRFVFASNILVLVTISVCVFLCLHSIEKFYYSGIVLYREYFYTILIFIAFFKPLRVLAIYSIFFMAFTTIIYLFSNKIFNVVLTPSITSSVVNGNLIFLAASIILFSFSYVTEKSLKAIETELATNKKLNASLDKKVIERTQELNSILTEVARSQKRIISSIEYAKRIQNSLLPSISLINNLIPRNLIIWQPRDIVGGDIYFVETNKNGFLIAIMDCTGHGVPGAMMTMMVSSSLKRITNDENCFDPADILYKLNYIVKTSLHQDRKHITSNDGLDAAVCYINTNTKTLTYAGARLPLTFIQNGEVATIKGNNHSIGYIKSDLDFKFTNHTIDIQDEMTFYLYTDGIIDQLGGKKRIPFGKKRFFDLLMKCHKLSFTDQRSLILKGFQEYKGSNEIQDDVTVFGFDVKKS